MAHLTHTLVSFKPNEDLRSCTRPFVTVVMDTHVIQIQQRFTVLEYEHDWLPHTANHAFLRSARLSSSIKIIHVGLIMLIVLLIVLNYCEQ